MLTLKNVERRKDRTYIRYGKSEVEIDGGEAGFRAWIAANQPSELHLLAMQLAAHIKTDDRLERLPELSGREVVVELKTETRVR